MGGGLLQKINRDTQRFAFKCSARQTSDEVWHDVAKRPLDTSKTSKAGRLKLVVGGDNAYHTVPEFGAGKNLLIPVFEDGRLLNEFTFDQIRANSQK